MSAPIRRCAGCGRRRAQRELVRFVERKGTLVAAPPGSGGRGAYTCDRGVCFERAASLNAFSRVLRRPVKVDPGLRRNYTDANG